VKDQHGNKGNGFQNNVKEKVVRSSKLSKHMFVNTTNHSYFNFLHFTNQFLDVHIWRTFHNFWWLFNKSKEICLKS